MTSQILSTNTHIHLPPNFSAFDSMDRAVELAVSQSISALGVSNYYDYALYKSFRRKAMEAGIFPLFGLEIICLIPEFVDANIKINDPGNPGKMYLCGKGIVNYEPMSVEASKLLQTIRDNDSERMALMLSKLCAYFEQSGFQIRLSPDGVRQALANRYNLPLESVYLQERHLSQALQEMMFDNMTETDRRVALGKLYKSEPKSSADDAVGTQNEIRSKLMKAGMPGFIEDTFVDIDHAYRLVLELGGIPSYPTLADGAAPITSYEASISQLISDLKSRNIPAVEFIPLRNQPSVLSEYVLQMREAGLFVTSGTEHNTLDLVPLAPRCADGSEVSSDIRAIFWEGACVIAAHQHLAEQDLPGFISKSGNLNSNYANADDRIREFAKIGSEIIANSTQNRK